MKAPLQNPPTSSLGQPSNIGFLETLPNWVRLTFATLLGFGNGYLILHPASMAFFRLLAENEHHGIHNESSIWITLLSSFQLKMLPMGLAYGVLGALVGIVYGYQRLTILRQRDTLRENLTKTRSLLIEIEHKSEQLAEQNNQLIELQEMRRRTIHFLVHDMKTQIGCIEVFSTLLLDDEQTRSEAILTDSLQRIRRQARAMSRSIGNMLGISRLERKPSLRLQKISPFDELQAAAENMRYPSNEYHIVVDPTSVDCPPVWAERELVFRVLLNLVSNAIKHNPPGTTVRLSAYVHSDHNHVVISCCDDGYGISANQADGLFEAFTSGENAAADSTGLGLAFARSVVEAHQGQIWYQSPPDEGAEFCFTLPRQQSNKENNNGYTADI